MLAFINILFLLLPASQTGSEAGINLLAGPTLELVDIHHPLEQDLLYQESDIQTGFNKGIGIYYNYHLNKDIYLGLNAIYRNYNATFRQLESEIINVEGKDTPGEFEHLFQYNAQSLSLILNAGYKINLNYCLNLGLSISNHLTDLATHSRETIVTPRDAGIFKQEGTRIRNRQDNTFRPLGTIFGLQVGTSALYPMNLQETIFLKPSLSYTYNLTNNTEQLQDWTTDFLDISLGVSFILGDNHIFEQRNVAPKPTFNMLFFELQGTVERDFRKLQINYDNATNIQNGEQIRLVKKENRTLIAYISIKELNRRRASFRIRFVDNTVFQEEIQQENNKIFIPLDGLINSLDDNSLLLKAITDDGFDKSQIIKLDFRKQADIQYLATDSQQELIDALNFNKDNELELYTDFNGTSKLLQKLGISNLTVFASESLPYTSERFPKKQFILLVK